MLTSTETQWINNQVTRVTNALEGVRKELVAVSIAVFAGTIALIIVMTIIAYNLGGHIK